MDEGRGDVVSGGVGGGGGSGGDVVDDGVVGLVAECLFHLDSGCLEEDREMVLELFEIEEAVLASCEFEHESEDLLCSCADESI